VRDERWKLWFGREPERAAATAPGAIAPDAERRPRVAPAGAASRLYDLDADIAETTDVATLHPDVVERLQAIAAAAARELGDDATRTKGTGVRPPGVVNAPRPLTEFVEVASTSPRSAARP
jgi:hypothetical protein